MGKVVDSTSDRQALEAIRRGDRVDENYSILYERHFEGVLRSLNRRTRSYEDALELTQETFVKLYTHATTLDPAREIEPWLHTVSRNLLRSWQRKQLRQRRDARLTTSMTIPTTPSGTMTRTVADSKGWTADSAVILDEFQRFVAELPEAVRIVFHMKYIAGQSYKKIQDLTGLTHEQIKHKLDSARKKYRETFGEGLLGGRWKR